MQHPRSTCNIQMKHFKHKAKTPETFETQCRRWAQPTWWGTPVASKLVSEGHRDRRSSIHPRSPGAARRPPFPADGRASAGLPCLSFCNRQSGWGHGAGCGAQSSARCGREQRRRGRRVGGVAEHGRGAVATLR